MLDVVFKTVLNLTITSSLVACVILAVRLFCSQFMPKRIVYALWFVLLIRLMIPFSLSTEISMFNAVPAPIAPEKVSTNEYIKLDPVKPSYPQINIELPSKLPASQEIASNSLIPSDKPNSADRIQVVYFSAAVLWTIGALSLLLLSLIGYLKIRLKLRTAYPYQNRALIQVSKARINFKRNIPVLLSEHLDNPIVCGLIHPRIILPVACENLEDNRLEKILVHELFHLRRLDNAVNMLFLFAVCIHFFNPVVWLCYVLFKKDMELSCDEKVISIFGNEAKADYAYALIDFSTRQNGLFSGGILSFGESNLKTRIKGIMNFKKKNRVLTALAVLIVILIAVVTLTNGSTNKPGNPAIGKPSALTPGPNIDSTSDSLYGAIQTPFPHFRMTPDPDPDSYPVIFEKDGKVGYQDKNGNVIVDAIYGMAHDYWNGVGSVRIDQEGAFIWKRVDTNGNFYDYDEVFGFHFGLSAVAKGGKYGFINTAGELVVPLNYDQLYCAYTDKARSTYAVRDNQFVYLNLTDGYEESFERYDPNKKAQYRRTIDIKDYHLAVANDMLIVNGKAQPMGFDFPIPILQGLDFDLYTQGKKLGTYQAKLTEGSYEGEVFVSFPEYNRSLINNTYEEYYAVLKSANINHLQVRNLEAAEKFTDTVKQYLKENKIENTTFSIARAFEGDFNGNGATGAVLEINDTYRKNGEEPKQFKEGWSEKRFAESKTAFVNAILIIDDVKKPLEYRMVKSNIWTHLKWDYMTENIGFIANLDADNQLELLISNGYYEYRDYAIVDLN